MRDDFYKSVIEESPTGYAYHKIICNEQDIPYDFEFIEINSAFEKYTGLKGVAIIGKRITEILPKISESEVDWIKIYGDIAINGGSKEIEEFSEALQRWYRIKVYSPEKYYFITYFFDISKERAQLTECKIMQEAVQKSEEKYRFLTEYTSDVIWVLNLILMRFNNPVKMAILFGLKYQQNIDIMLMAILRL